MEIEVSQEKLSKALNNISRIAVGKVTLTVLNNVLISIDIKRRPERVHSSLPGPH